jgi:hypothetical protein
VQEMAKLFVVSFYNPTGPWTDEPNMGGTTTTNLVTVYMTVENIIKNVGHVTSIQDADGTELIIDSNWVSTDNKFDVTNLRPATRGGISFHLPSSARTVLAAMSDSGQDLNWWYGPNLVDDETTENIDLGVETSNDEEDITRYLINSKVTTVNVVETSSWNFILIILFLIICLVIVYYIWNTPIKGVVSGRQLTRRNMQLTR